MSLIDSKYRHINQCQTHIRQYYIELERFRDENNTAKILMYQLAQQSAYIRILGLRKDIAVEQINQRYDLNRKINENKILIDQDELERNFDEWMTFINENEHPIFIKTDDKEMVLCPFNIYNDFQQMMNDYENG